MLGDAEAVALLQCRHLEWRRGVRTSRPAPTMISKESPRNVQDVDRSILRTDLSKYGFGRGGATLGLGRGDEVEGGLERCIGESHLTQCGRNGQGNCL